MSYVPQYGVHRDAANSKVALNYAGDPKIEITSSGATIPSGETLTIAGSLVASGTVSLGAGSIERADLATESTFLDLEDKFRGADGADLALSETAGDFFREAGSALWNIKGEATINETEVSVGLFTFVLPDNYVAGGTITLRANALVQVAGDAVLNAASTIDMTAQKVTLTTGAVGADLVTTAATAIVAAGAAYDFVVTPTGLVAGDKLSCSLTTSIVEDAAGTGAATAVIARLGAVLQVKG